VTVLCSLRIDGWSRFRELFYGMCDFVYLLLAHGEHEQRHMGLAIFGSLTRERLAELEM
jgi:hypothetical protein